MDRLKQKYHPKYPLHVASGKKCNLSDVKILVEVCGLDVIRKDSDGKTSVYYAAYYKNKEVENFLMDKIANYQDKEMGKIAGEYEEAIQKPRLKAQEVVRDYEKEFPQGTPMVCACERGRLKDVQLLMKGHDVRETGMSVEEMISIEGRDSYGCPRTPLGAAVENKKFEVVSYLIKNTKNTDIIVENVDRYGCNSLHYAAWKWGSKDEKSKDEKSKDKKSKDKKSKDEEMLEKLIKKCKNKLPECKKRKELSINAMDKDGHTPLDYAYRFNSSKEKDKKKNNRGTRKSRRMPQQLFHL